MKSAKAIDERRKKVKEVINQPYAEFEKELKEITDLIKKQSAEIDEQVKAFETAEKEEKRAKIMEAYEKAVGNLAEILPFSKVFDQRYLNKTCKLESAIADVQKKIEQVKTDLETIESVCGKYKLNAKDIYVRTMDLSKAMAEEKRLKDLEEKLEAERIQKEKAAEERRKAEEEALNNIMDVVDGKATSLKRSIKSMTGSQEWKDADFFGKVDIAWDKIIAEPFMSWAGSEGKSMLSQGIGKLFSSASAILPGGEKAGLTSWLSAGLIGVGASKLISGGKNVASALTPIGSAIKNIASAASEADTVGGFFTSLTGMSS